MKMFTRIFAALLLTILLVLPIKAEEPSLEKFTALAAAEQFLLLLDQGKYEKAWDSASELFHKLADRHQWEGRVGHLRDQYGDFKNRQLRFSKEMQNIEGAPKGDYFFLIYGSSFAVKDSVIETLTLTKESDGLWRISGYSIN